MDYGTGGLFILLGFLLLMLVPALLDPEAFDYGGPYQFDVKTEMEHERAAIQAESLIWMNQNE